MKHNVKAEDLVSLPDHEREKMMVERYRKSFPHNEQTVQYFRGSSEKKTK
jgi:hypothetical protein